MHKVWHISAGLSQVILGTDILPHSKFYGFSTNTETMITIWEISAFNNSKLKFFITVSPTILAIMVLIFTTARVPETFTKG